MSNSTAPEIPVSADTLLLIGPIVTWAFLAFRSSSYNSDIYYLSFPSDPVIIQGSVYAIFILDIFQSVVVATAAWHSLCSGWGHPSALEFPGWTFTALPCVSGIVAAWVQTFFAWRIHILGKWKLLPCLIIFLALAQCGAAWAIGIGFIPLRDIQKLHMVDMFARTIIWLGGAALADVAIAFSMFYLLYSAKQRTKFQQTDRIISRLIRVTVETGAITATSAIVELILFQTMQTNNLHFTMYVIPVFLQFLYSNAFMASLNSRSGSKLSHESHSISTMTSSTQWNHTFLNITRRENQETPAVIHLETTTEVDTEDSKLGVNQNKNQGHDIEMDTLPEVRRR
ncbi:hypothetical protein BDP27DRAFT_1394255 [Rhodocollybia butyracea]|uniref:DUF6534 domain-containing protein n=1 Tax=Rhodocollybia butyracea TaxID=206335 RepID=A0A9P5PEZ8_9AGAR|nr:hypothetical protein BDP27DRAFT_1394255 [Rhodocollybia butyracea]